MSEKLEKVKESLKVLAKVYAVYFCLYYAVYVLTWGIYYILFDRKSLVNNIKIFLKKIVDMERSIISKIRRMLALTSSEIKEEA